MRLDHVTVLTSDVGATAAFYRDVLGLEPGPRPPFSFAGAWLYAGGTAVVHLKAPGLGDAPGGVIEHVAFAVDDFDAAVARLAGRGIPHRLGRLPDGTRRQCFLHDPNGAVIELTGD